MNKYIGIAGTNSPRSTNKKLMEYIQSHFAGQAEIELMSIADLPVFYKVPGRVLPPRVEEMDKLVDEADGVIIATPEYDHSVPAVLMNALEWMSYGGTHPFVGKPVMIVGASYGTLGASRAQAHLRQILDSPEMQARIMPSSEFLVDHSLQAFDEAGNLTDSEKVERLEQLFTDFETFVEISKHLNASLAANKQLAANYTWEDEEGAK
ncbi:NADPH-dependent FMN reductase [Ligilactobacillus agilis]|jgi:NAD(P)H-dependent FMN reductase|uniref:Oxidoreductase n=2 Tax=Ligilactobacillus agilis TaxID=1601 RepID=A0A0R2A8R9_9LACO|nr:NADPH-dependent FMN reductase [Ligilactobacillus agilis]ASR41590.1 NADPH-dependent FMN reductase [Ligilactobacillus agilis]KRM63199.1 oxidoreductase [Ligilactobacillus agilis DSM 20509]MBL1056279.1 NAD(P)H-dependent oxidoreductase [Ligilactobacillus agilis]MBM6763459.1 NAD(P)H-dependent oxidoreductase [Ligilactobacillus agilis]MBM6773637.1 NAD(P)H-dependent oxidoreductase [Ligilactobacillus agilis]